MMVAGAEGRRAERHPRSLGRGCGGAGARTRPGGVAPLGRERPEPTLSPDAGQLRSTQEKENVNNVVVVHQIAYFTHARAARPVDPRSQVRVLTLSHDSSGKGTAQDTLKSSQ
ncbi:uncharacterized protein LOC123384041 isoform X5 [Felis catus]|uniref:uncharacterized protein LOC123384041 isoform X5 n=1 Tax=Felis catus TaxID=9685 RepID=UPI001D19B020|nr:uncharacterized protein LOC123384041 isoform X5 [Felis catus]